MAQKIRSTKFDGKELVEKAQEVLGIAPLYLRGRDEWKVLEIIRDNAREALQHTNTEEKEREIKDSRNTLLFTLALLYGRRPFRDYAPYKQEIRDALVANAYERAIEVKHFVRAANIAKEWLDSRKVQQAVNMGHDWYSAEGHPVGLEELRREFGLKVEEDEMRTATIGAYMKRVKKGDYGGAAVIVKKYYPAEDDKKREMIHSVISTEIEELRSADLLYDALLLARKYIKYGFEEEEKKISESIDKAFVPGGNWEAFRDRFNSNGYKRFMRGDSLADLPQEEEWGIGGNQKGSAHLKRELRGR